MDYEKFWLLLHLCTQVQVHHCTNAPVYIYTYVHRYIDTYIHTYIRRYIFNVYGSPSRRAGISSDGFCRNRIGSCARQHPGCGGNPSVVRPAAKPLRGGRRPKKTAKTDYPMQPRFREEPSARSRPDAEGWCRWAPQPGSLYPKLRRLRENALANPCRFVCRMAPAASEGMGEHAGAGTLQPFARGGCGLSDF